MDGWVTIGTKLDTKNFEKQIEQTENKLNDLEATLKMADSDKTLFSTSEIKEMEAEVERLKNKLSDLYKKQYGTGGGGIDFSEVSKGISKTITSVGKWALAIFSVRTAYSLVRQAMSTLTQYNDDLANKLNSIKVTLAYALEPIITRLVNFVWQLLSYVNYLSKAWFKVDLFAKVNQSTLNKSVGAAKELRKQLTGFDEMNVLTDNTSSSGSAGGSQITLPEELKNGTEPKWLQIVKDVGKWIIDNWEQVVGFLLLTGTVFDLLTGNYAGAFLKIIGFIALGIYEIYKSVVDLWNVLKPYLAKAWEWIKKSISDSWHEFTNLLKQLGILVINTIKSLSSSFTNFINDQVRIVGKLLDAFRNVKDGILKIFSGDLAGGLKLIMQGIINTIIALINNSIDGINYILTPVRSVISEIGKLLGKNTSLSTVKIPHVPSVRLAKGGIINMPGRGVPIAGERGAEGVIPLTDSQQMALLGEAIGRYITVNANITNTMNGRIISRELQKVQNANNFATNN